MERIEALISKLKDQFTQNADPAVMLGTVQLLEFELTRMNSTSRQSLGTSKVAVVLPATNGWGPASSEQYEKYAPKPAEPVVQVLVKEIPEEIEPENQQVKETLLVDDGSISVVQKNGQLDMVFDPLTEIPTLSQQPREKEVNDMTAKGESLNDKLKQEKLN